MSAHSKAKEGTLGSAGPLEILSGELGRGPAGRLMQRVLRDHPEASIRQVMQLFRDAAVDDQAAFEDVITLAFRRDSPKPQEQPPRRRAAPVLTFVKK